MALAAVCLMANCGQGRKMMIKALHNWSQDRRECGECLRRERPVRAVTIIVKRIGLKSAPLIDVERDELLQAYYARRPEPK